MEEAPGWLDAFKPAPDALLRAVSAHITDDMLRDIAEADYGQGVERHWPPLLRLRDQGSVPVARESYWYPMEVLELIRYSNPDDPAHKPGATGARGHWMRAFASLALLRIVLEPGNGPSQGDLDLNLIQLLDSLHRLRAGFGVETQSFLAWAIPRVLEADADVVAFFGVGILSAALEGPNQADDDTIIALSEWISAAEQSSQRGKTRRRIGDSTWLLDGGRGTFNTAWRQLGQRLAASDLSRRNGAAQEWVRTIGSALSGP